MPEEPRKRKRRHAPGQERSSTNTVPDECESRDVAGNGRMNREAGASASAPGLTMAAVVSAVRSDHEADNPGYHQPLGQISSSATRASFSEPTASPDRDTLETLTPAELVRHIRSLGVMDPVLLEQIHSLPTSTLELIVAMKRVVGNAQQEERQQQHQ